MKKDFYTKLLKELKKGNAVCLEVNSKYDQFNNRFRLVSPKSCEWDYWDVSGSKLTESCFFRKFNANPDDIVSRMQDYDERYYLKIVKLQVLK